MTQVWGFTKRAILWGLLLMIVVTAFVQCGWIPEIPSPEKVVIQEILDDILKEEPPITTNISDAVTEVPFLDDYDPDDAVLMTVLPRTSEGGFILSRSGIYTFSAQSYCLQAGTYTPGIERGGDGYLYAPLKGPRAIIIRNVLQRSLDHPEIPQYLIQVLLWAIIARTKLSEMSPINYPTAVQLLTPEELFELNGGVLGLIPKDLIEDVFAELPAPMRQVLEAEARLRRMLTVEQATYEEIERVAVLQGNPPAQIGDTEVPWGRWSFHAHGYFLRYFPSGFMRTLIELSVPKQYDIIRDEQGRITQVIDEYGNLIEISYDDTIEPAAISGDDNVIGYAFKSIRFVQYVFIPPELIADIEATWSNTGWTFVGVPSGERIVESSLDRFPDLAERYEWAKEYKMQVEKLSEELNIGDIFEDIIDLGHLSVALESVIVDRDEEMKWVVGHTKLVKEAWQYVICNREGNYKVGDELTFDPSEGIAQPGKQGRQRLALSSRSADKDADKKHACEIIQKALDRQEIILYAYNDPYPLVVADQLDADDYEYDIAAKRYAAHINAEGGVDSYFERPGKMERFFEDVPPRPQDPGDPGEAGERVVSQENGYNEPYSTEMFLDNYGVWGHAIQGGVRKEIRMVKPDGTVVESGKAAVLQSYIDEYGKLAGEVLFDVHLAHEMTHLEWLQDISKPTINNPEGYSKFEIEAYETGIAKKTEALVRLGCE